VTSYISIGGGAGFSLVIMITQFNVFIQTSYYVSIGGGAGFRLVIMITQFNVFIQVLEFKDIKASIQNKYCCILLSTV
jgi:hypothetical protein